MGEQIRIAIVDDHSLCRRGLTSLLDQRNGITVVGATGNADELMQLLRDHDPDLLIMDLRMEPVGGLTLLSRLRNSDLHVPVMILTMSDSETDLANALRAGVRGYLLKDMAPEDVIDAVRRIVFGELVVAPAMTSKLTHILQHGQQEQVRTRSLKLLTEREREILEHLARGESNKAIAMALNISHDTVKLHVRHILAKLKLASRVEAAVFATKQQALEGQFQATH
jgi:two-component system nitrate/nitrite response regulator NarL